MGESQISVERQVWQAVADSNDNVVIVQGLPVDVHAEEMAPILEDISTRNVFMTLSAALANQYAKYGVEVYSISDIPELDRDVEIAAYARAHEDLNDAYAELSEEQRDLFQLTADDDLAVTAVSHFIPDLVAHLQKQGRKDGRRIKLIPIFRNRDDSYGLAGSFAPATLVDVQGKFVRFQVKPLPQPDRGVESGAVTNLDQLPVKALSSTDAGKPCVFLCVKYGPTHFSYDEVIWKLGAALEERGVTPVFISEGEKLVAGLRESGFDVLDIQTVDAPERKEFREISQRIRGEVWPFSVFQNSEAWPRRMMLQLERVARCRALVDAYQPLSIATYPYGSQIARAIRLSGKLAGVSSFTPFILGLAGHARGYPVMDEDTGYMLYGHEAHEMMLDWGVAEDQLLVTGNPRYDALQGFAENREEFRQQIVPGISPDTLLALVATTGLLELDRLWLDSGCRQAAKHGVEMVIKPHPSLKAEDYAKWADEWDNVRVWFGNLNEATAACDVMFTDYSSTGFEATLFNRPLLSVNFSPNEFAYRWEDEGVAVRVSTEEEIGDQFDAISQGRFSADVLEGQKKQAFRYNYLNDGKALERMVDLLVKS